MFGAGASSSQTTTLPILWIPDSYQGGWCLIYARQGALYACRRSVSAWWAVTVNDKSSLLLVQNGFSLLLVQNGSFVHKRPSRLVFR